MDSTLWRRWMGGGIALVVAYFAVLPSIPNGQDAGYFVIAAICTVCTFLGVRIHRPQNAAVWYLLGAGQMAWVLGNGVWNTLHITSGDVAYPSLADPLYLVAYPLFGVGVLLARKGGGPPRSGAALEALIVTLGAALVSWVLLLRPYLESPGVPLLAKAVSMAYPIGDLFLLGMLAPMIGTLRRRNLSSSMLVWWVALLVITDSIYGVMVLQDSYALGSWVDAGWLIGWVLLAGAALHPSMAGGEPPSTTDVDPRSLSRVRLAVLGLAALAGPLVIVLESVRGNAAEDLLVVAIGGVALTSLVVTRIATLFGESAAYASELAEARDEATQATGLKSKFLATMTHEIRTPMNGVIGLTELLGDTDLDDLQRHYVEALATSGTTLLSITNDILDFSKIEADKLELEKADFDLRAVIEDIANLTGEAARARGLELNCYCDPDLQPLRQGDAVRVRQILVNLASNAVKFTDHGEVVVSAVADTERMDVVRFAVTDTGPGIGPEDRQRLFRPFSQVDASTTRRFGGTGLGLAITAQLARAMGGSIGVNSSLGEGSTFWVEIPFDRAVSPEPEVPAVDAALRGLRVLVVAGNETTQRVVRLLLLACGIEADVAGDGAGALGRLKAQARHHAAYDVALVDGDVPGMGGAQLCRQIRADAAMGSTRLVILGSGSADDAQEAIASSAQACLRKPVLWSELRACLRSVMETTAPAASCEQGLGATVHGHLGRVLIAEDNSINQMVAAAMCQTIGYAADVVGNGAEALDALSREEYSAVLMDCQMPVMDGYQASAELRRRHNPVPVIAMTASAVVGDRERCLAAGMNDFVMKPMRRELLGEVLHRWVKDAPAASRV